MVFARSCLKLFVSMDFSFLYTTSFFYGAGLERGVENSTAKWSLATLLLPSHKQGSTTLTSRTGLLEMTTSSMCPLTSWNLDMLC